MNFYKHYIGDYQRDTGHLSLAEHGAYRLMLDTFYATEKPLPADRKALYRLLRADGAAERKAIDVIASEFWTLTDDGLINERANLEIGKAEKQAEANRQIAITREAKKRARTSNDSLHENEHEDSTNRATNRSTNAEPNHNHSHNQTIKPNHLSGQPTELDQPGRPVDKLPDREISEKKIQEPETGPPSRATQVAVLLRAQGIKPFSFAHPQAIEWGGNPKVTDEILKAAVQQARDYKPEGDISPNYLKPIIEQLVNPPEPKAPKPPADAWWLSNPGIERKGRELGMQARGTESYNDFKDRIFAEIRKRDGKPTEPP